MKIRKILSVFAAAVIVIIPLISLSAFAADDETPVIVEVPKNLQWPEGSLASYKCECENDPDHDKFEYEWHIVYDGKDYTFKSELDDPWCDYIEKNTSSADKNVLNLNGINHVLNGAEIYCLIKNNGAEAKTPKATVFIIDEDKFTPPVITAPVFVTCAQGDELDLTVRGEGTAGNVSLTRDYISYHWYTAQNGSINDLIPIETGKDVYENGVYRVDTSKTGTYYFVCGVFDGLNNENMCNYSYTNVITVEVTEKAETEPVTDTQEETAAEETTTAEETETVTETETETETEEITTAADETENTAEADTVTSEETADTEETVATTEAEEAVTTEKPAETDARKTPAKTSTAVIVLSIVAAVLFVALIAAFVIVIMIIKKPGK